MFIIKPNVCPPPSSIFCTPLILVEDTVNPPLPPPPPIQRNSWRVLCQSINVQLEHSFLHSNRCITLVTGTVDKASPLSTTTKKKHCENVIDCETEKKYFIWWKLNCTQIKYIILGEGRGDFGKFTSFLTQMPPPQQQKKKKRKIKRFLSFETEGWTFCWNKC